MLEKIQFLLEEVPYLRVMVVGKCKQGRHEMTITTTNTGDM